MTHDPTSDQPAGWRRLSVYLEPRDWWIGVYVAPGAVFVCPLPMLVFRWQRRTRLRPWPRLSDEKYREYSAELERRLVGDLDDPARVDSPPPAPPPGLLAQLRRAYGRPFGWSEDEYQRAEQHGRRCPVCGVHRPITNYQDRDQHGGAP